MDDLTGEELLLLGLEAPLQPGADGAEAHRGGGAGIMNEIQQSGDKPPAGVLKLTEGGIEGLLARLGVGQSKGRVVQPAAEGGFGETTGMGRFGDGGLGEQSGDGGFLFAVDLAAVTSLCGGLRVEG